MVYGISSFKPYVTTFHHSTGVEHFTIWSGLEKSEIGSCKTFSCGVVLAIFVENEFNCRALIIEFLHERNLIENKLRILVRI